MLTLHLGYLLNLLELSSFTKPSTINQISLSDPSSPPGICLNKSVYQILRQIAIKSLGAIDAQDFFIKGKQKVFSSKSLILSLLSC